MGNIALARSLMDAGNAGNWRPLVDRLADDVTFTVTVPDGTPMAKQVRGKEAVAEHLAGLGELIEFKQEQPSEYFEDGDRVVLLGLESYEIKKTGDVISGSHYATVLDFRQGMITSFLIIQDLSAFADAHRGG